MNKIIKTLTHYIFTLIVLGYIFYEELVWERFALPIVRFVQSFKLLKRLEILLKGVNGGVILVTFVLLFAVAELQGIYAGMLLLKGKVLLWALIYAGKIPIAAFTFWLFRVSKPKLMAFPWFVKTYDFLMKSIEWVNSTDTYKMIKTKSVEIRNTIKKKFMSVGGSTKVKFKRIYHRLRTLLKRKLKP